MSTTPSRARYIAQFTHPTPPPLSVYAVVGLVLSVLGISLLGVLLASFALTDIRDGLRTGRPAALVGLVLGAVGTIIWGALLASVVNPGMLR